MRSPRSSSRAGLPPGVFNLVMGRGSVVGEAMLNHPGRRRDHLHRLGRHRPASKVASAASRAWRKFQLEMGGKNPLVVLDDADLRPRRRVRGQRRLLLHRPALHGVVAADRHRRHPRPLRRGA
jgi:acyl-CoA reductase-like NAD-dependent aldehyde dehydrogenase